MKITTFPLGPLGTNCFVVQKEGKAVVIDPGGDPAEILKHLEDEGLELTHILVTHLHFDHIYGNKALAEATGAPILANPKDSYLMDSEVGRGGAWGLPLVEPFDFDPISEGEAEFVGSPCTVLATPGHTPGSLTFYFPEAETAIVGDLIFYRSVGRTDFPGGDAEVLKNSVTEKIFPLPPETVLKTGHGPDTSVGDEKNHNPYFTGNLF